MKSNPNRRAIIVGLFIFLGLMFLLAGILAIGNLHNSFVKKMTVTTIFNDVNGLQRGNNVWFSGVKIGTVNDLDFYGKSQVKVQMKIDEKSQQYIRKDAKVKISTDGLIGNKIIVIYGGSSTVDAVVEGDTLGIEYTLTTDSMMNTFQANNKNLLEITTDFKAITKRINAGEGSLGKLLNDDALYTNINTTIASLQKASSKAAQLTASLTEYGNKLNQKNSLANNLVTDTTVFKSLKVTTSKLQEVAASASDVVTNMKEATKDLNNTNSPAGVLLHDEQTALDLKSAIKNLDSSSQKLNEDLEGLQHNFLLRKYFRKKAKEENSVPK
ncbi:MAG: MCE family protein [Chitinophagales bacterium]|nr:MCE family protein [Chitinophagales bacterium]